jgi:nitrite reductase (NADH) small subunit
VTITLESPAEHHPAAIAPAWVPICPVDELIPGRGVAALLNPGTRAEPQIQVAVFRTSTGQLYAVDNRDPFTGACVISRGLIGTREGTHTVASPMLKHVFDLRTGRCMDGPAGPQPEALPVYPVRCVDGHIYVAAAESTQNGA